jgi:hypothetical protein
VSADESRYEQHTLIIWSDVERQYETMKIRARENTQQLHAVKHCGRK